MNKKHYFYCCLVLLASAALWGCLREFDLKPGEAAGQPEEFSVAEAREFFETISQDLTVQGIIPNDSNGIKVMPLWKFGKSLKINDAPTVETPLNIIPYYSWDQGSYDPVVHGRILVNTLMLLIAQKNGKGEIDYRVAKFIGDDDYMMDNRKKFFASPLSALPDFSGKVIYYDLGGNPLEGFVYKDGRQSGVLLPAEGKGEPTMRGDATGESLHYERFTIEWKSTTRDGNELPEVIIIGDPSPFDPSPCYYDSEDPGGGGGSGGSDPDDPGGGGGGGDSGGGGSGGGNTTRKITLSLSPPNPCLGEEFIIGATTVNLNGCEIKCKIAPYEKAENETYYDVLGNPGSYLCKIPGKYVIVAETEYNGEKITSSKVDLEIVFPDRNAIMAMSEITSAIDEAWDSTVNDAGATQYREHGFVAYINTRGGNKVIDIDKRQSPYASYSGSGVQINLSYDKDQPQQGDFIDGGRYVIFSFHTHPPFFNATGGTYHRYARITPAVGGSPGDVSADIPAATKDYPGIWSIADNGYTHSNTDPVTSPQIWPYGPDRRTKFPL